MRKILAVSGGIDSVVMLHLFRGNQDAIVAHFNHGIRPNSADDQVFVRKLAKEYGLKYVTKTIKLGPKASEADARKARYDYLFSICTKYDGKLYVAHHREDIYESIAINVLRGTGWRGLAPLRNSQIERPLIDWQKSNIYIYATENHLSFRQDQSNTEGDYLRNRVRVALMNATKAQKEQLYQLYLHQCDIANEIEQLLSEPFIKEEKYINRSIFQHDSDDVSIELLRQLLQKHHISQTRPQLQRALKAIQTYQPGKRFPLGKDFYLQIAKYHFSIKKSNG